MECDKIAKQIDYLGQQPDGALSVMQKSHLRGINAAQDLEKLIAKCDNSRERPQNVVMEMLFLQKILCNLLTINPSAFFPIWHNSSKITPMENYALRKGKVDVIEDVFTCGAQADGVNIQ